MTELLATGRDGAVRLGVARMAFGVVGMVAPEAIGRAWVGQDGGSSAVAVITRAFAIRDLAVGLGTVLAARRGAPVRGWLEAGLLCDAGDALSTLVSRLPAQKKAPLTATAVTGIVGGALAMSGLDRRTGTA